MKHLLQTLAVVLTTAFLGGCATQNASIASDVFKRLNRVGVVSVTANRFTRQYVGVTAFGNEWEEKALAEWNINAQYEGQIALAVESVLGAKAVRAPYVAADFSRVNDVNGPWDAPAFRGPNWGAIEGSTKAYCAANNLDAVIVVGRLRGADIFGGTNQGVDGAGIYSRRSINVMHLVSVVGLLDCKTAAPLAVQGLKRRQPGAALDAGMVVPTRELPSEIARTKIPDWTPEVESQIKQLIVSLPGSAWQDTLGAMVPRTK